MQSKRLGAGESIDASGAEGVAAEALQQEGRVIERRARRIPLEQDKLHIVALPPLPGTKRPGKLIDRSGALGQHPLHQRLGARLEIVRRDRRAIELHFQRIDSGLRQHLRGENRRIDLQKTAAVEHLSEARAHESPLLQQAADRRKGRAHGDVSRAGEGEPLPEPSGRTTMDPVGTPNIPDSFFHSQLVEAHARQGSGIWGEQVDT